MAREENLPEKKRLEEALGNIGNDLGDMRLPPADVYGLLTDCQIRKHDIPRICGQIATIWPAVKRIDCGTVGNNRPCFYIYLDPYKQPNETEQKILTDWIGAQYPQTAHKVAFSFFSFLGLDPDAISTSVMVYDAAKDKRAGR